MCVVGSEFAVAVQIGYAQIQIGFGNVAQEIVQQRLGIIGIGVAVPIHVGLNLSLGKEGSTVYSIDRCGRQAAGMEIQILLPLLLENILCKQVSGQRIAVFLVI